ncbi:MAG: response regulator [Treponemataceae bacterium]|nr:response regulator [Treponemataceae bacterium]
MADTNLANPFFANAVHELRTPIQTIIGTLELMDETTLNPEQAEYVRQVGVSADILLSLVNDLLDFSKIQSGKFKVEKIGMNPVVVAETTVDLMSIEAHNRGLEIFTDIDYSLSTSVWGDPTRIQQVILNLVKNAVKFTSSGYVCVRLTRVPEKENRMRFEVLDSGIGVADDKKDAIFKDFVQADASTTRKYGGTGLGLSICKNLVTLMGGDIGVTDNPEGHGSCFWFEVPCEPCPDKAENDMPSTALTIPADTRILVIDDSPMAVRSLTGKLHALGASNVDAAFGGEEGLEKMRQAAAENRNYAIVLIDMIMPKWDGWRLSAEINADKSINSSRLYMMVPEGQMGGEAKMKMLDWFNGYVYKPIKRNKLAETLNELNAGSMELEEAKPAETAAPAATQPAPAASDTPQYPFNLLIAEDHPVNQKLLRTFLEKFGATVVSANNGREAVERLAEHPETDLIFMDIQMPEMNGVEATDTIRASGYKGVIIACTANTDESDFALYKEHGMNDILVKPFKKTNCADILEKWKTVIEPEEIEELEELEEAEAIEIPEDTGDFIVEADDGKNIITQLWDYDDFLETVNHSEELARDLVIQFIDQTRGFLFMGKEAILDKNHQGIARIGHVIAGSAGSLSSETLYKTAKALEEAGKAENAEQEVALLNKLGAEFSRFEFMAQEMKARAHEKLKGIQKQ